MGISFLSAATSLLLVACWPNVPEPQKTKIITRREIQYKVCINVAPPRKPSYKELRKICEYADDWSDCVVREWAYYEYKLETWVEGYIPPECYSSAIEWPVLDPKE